MISRKFCLFALREVHISCRECEFKLRWRGLKRVNSVRGQGSRLIDRVSGSSQPGASPVVPNSPPRNSKRDIRVTLMGAKHRDLLTETEESSRFFYRVKTMDSSVMPCTMTTKYFCLLLRSCVQSIVDMCYVENKSWIKKMTSKKNK